VLIVFTPLNLRRWNYKTDPKCALCSSTSPTIHHILNYCSMALDQGQLTWRHDSVLQHLAKNLEAIISTDKSKTLYADLPGKLASSSTPSTLPSSISSSSDMPDIELVSQDEMTIPVLTVCFHAVQSFEIVRRRKE